MLVQFPLQTLPRQGTVLVRVGADLSATSIKAKISKAEQLHVHTMPVSAGHDKEAGVVSVHLHGKGNIGAKHKAEVVAEILATTKERCA